MKTTYEWLLHNMGNEANYLTILNVQQQTNEVGIARIDVMARTEDFKVVNLVIGPEDTGNGANSTLEDTAEKSISASYLFSNEQSVITYLSEGQSAAMDTARSGIRLLVLEPADGAGEITFPPGR
ncbi:hypothetical protein [Spirosoma luteum]|uniref:hypothetical protein n=1 Tax=Spirosoma luteum TaxID=431553 RepID=UPI000364142F|nr:hypothetical protein [Spirosoma luteum]